MEREKTEKKGNKMEKELKKLMTLVRRKDRKILRDGGTRVSDRHNSKQAIIDSINDSIKELETLI